MNFQPKKLKYTKMQKGKIYNCFQNNIDLKAKSIKTIKIVALESGRITVQQLVTIRAQIKKSIKKIGLLQFKACPQMPLTKKPAEIRMGKGKGSFDHWVLNSSFGMSICEVYFNQYFMSKVFILMQKTQKRLPIKTKIVFI
jgi:large subunit ribosomal protein L16